MCDTYLMDGIAHFWEKAGEINMLSDLIALWLRRAKTAGMKIGVLESGAKRAGSVITR